MPDPDDQIPSTDDPTVNAALRRIRGKFQDLEDALIVQAVLEKKMSERINEHAHITANHDRIKANHDQMMAEHDVIWRRIDVTMAEMTEKVHFLINREMKREGGPEAS